MIFVEGDSDEKVYRVLLSRIGYEKSLVNVVFAPIEGIGRVRCKQRRHFFRLCSVILDRVSKLPIHYFFVSDKHEKDDRSITKLKDRYREKVRLLPRYEIENYLLEAAAICSAINEEVELYYGDKSEKKRLISDLSPGAIENTLKEPENDSQFYRDKYPDFNKWERSVRGSLLLDKVYSRWGLSYDKTSSGPRIAKCLNES